MDQGQPQQPPPMFIRVAIDGAWYDVAIADISAIEVPRFSNQPTVHLIIGGLHATIAVTSYETLHAAWVARRRSDAGR